MRLDIRFCLEHQHFIQLVLPAHIALEIVRLWSTCDPKFKDKKRIGSVDGYNTEGNISWSVEVSRIIAIHTFPPEALQQTNQSQQQGLGYPIKGSGLN